MDQKRKKLDRIEHLSTLLDTKFEGPFGIRFGIDGLIGIIPGGDFFTSALSLYIIAEAAALGVSTATLTRMAINVAVENLVDLIPIFGSLFDFYWKANQRNLLLLQNHLDDPGHETIKSRMVIGLIAVFLLLVLMFSVYVSYRVLQYAIEFVTTALNT